MPQLPVGIGILNGDVSVYDPVRGHGGVLKKVGDWACVIEVCRLMRSARWRRNWLTPPAVACGAARRSSERQAARRTWNGAIQE